MTVYSTSLRLWEGVPGDPAIRNAWGTALNENQNLIESAILGTVSVNINGLTSYTLTTANGAADQARPLVQSYTGALTGDCTVTLPNVPKYGWAQNQTTGGHNVILKAGAGLTAVIPSNGFLYWYFADGATNVFIPSAGFGSLISNGAFTVGGAASFLASASFTTGVTTTGNDAGGFNIRFKNTNYGAGWQNNDADTFLLLTNPGNPNGTANSLRPFTMHNATGAVTIDGTGQGATFGGNLTARFVGVTTGGQGGAQLVVGSSGNPGLLAITNASGTAVGYAGSTDGANSPLLGAQNGFTGWRVPGTFTVDGLTNLVGGNGNPIGSLVSGWTYVAGGAAAGYAQSGTPLALGNGVLGGNVLSFFFGNNPTGSVANNGSGTGVVYNNTSDGRLKIRRGRITNSGSIIDRIAALWFNWKASPDAEPEPGFFAQQLHRVCPWMVTKGRGRPGSKGFVPWQIDKSALLPVLVAELQDVRRRLAALEAGR